MLTATSQTESAAECAIVSEKERQGESATRGHPAAPLGAVRARGAAASAACAGEAWQGACLHQKAAGRIGRAKALGQHAAKAAGTSRLQVGRGRGEADDCGRTAPTKSGGGTSLECATLQNRDSRAAST